MTRRPALLPVLAALLLALVAAPPALAAGPSTGPSAAATVSFSGHDWIVKAYKRKIGPGPNLFAAANASVDSAGRLHLRISRDVRGRWTCAEVINTRNLGYGTYTFVLDSRVDALDRNVVLGLFTWDDDPADAHRENDIEYARWGNAADPTNGQFVVQPWDAAGHLRRFTFGTHATSTQRFTWAPGRVDFEVFGGAPEAPVAGSLIAWSYPGADVPRPGLENARLNLWLYRGAAPSDGRAVEVVVRAFSFTPLP